MFLVNGGVPSINRLLSLGNVSLFPANPEHLIVVYTVCIFNQQTDKLLIPPTKTAIRLQQKQPRIPKGLRFQPKVCFRIMEVCHQLSGYYHCVGIRLFPVDLVQ